MVHRVGKEVRIFGEDGMKCNVKADFILSDKMSDLRRACQYLC